MPCLYADGWAQSFSYLLLLLCFATLDTNQAWTKLDNLRREKYSLHSKWKPSVVQCTRAGGHRPIIGQFQFRRSHRPTVSVVTFCGTRTNQFKYPIYFKLSHECIIGDRSTDRDGWCWLARHEQTLIRCVASQISHNNYNFGVRSSDNGISAHLFDCDKCSLTN